ncbi:MAG: Beta-phosphoglucomutase [Verrucomicrobiae bacterium]|nr:Beta-phosphoglucomutase [Verrucomicrobiae bacterium]
MIQGVIFDLDGVLVSTDEFHYLGWQRLADSEGIYFDRRINERLRGVSRMESLAILLERATKTYSPPEKEAMAARKNAYYRELLQQITPRDVLPGVLPVLEGLKVAGIKTAIASSSRNCPLILERTGLAGRFDAVADGNHITNSKPDPEIFLLAARRLGLPAQVCLVVEDAEAGVTGALAAGMKVLAVGFAAADARAQLRAKGLGDVSVPQMLAV